MEDLLQQVEKQFLSGYPLNKWFWEDILTVFGKDLNEILHQDALLEKTINHHLMEKFPLKLSYRTMFLKTLINKMEERNIAVSGDIYEAYCHILGECGNSKLHFQEKHFRHFVLDKKYISLMESTSIVSEGTTGLHAWQASMALAEWCLANQQTILKNKKILELGSGIGFTGLACLLGTIGHSVEDQSSESTMTKRSQPHKPAAEDGDGCHSSGNSHPPLSFTFSDCHPSVLRFLCGNVRQNLMEIDGDSSDLNLEKSSGGCPLLETNYGSTKVRVIDLLWQDLEGGEKDAIEMVGQVDVVLAADVVYDQSLFQPLIGSLKRLITNINEGVPPKVIIACTKRNPATLKEFMDCLSTSGLLAHENGPVQPQHFIYDPDPPVGIYCISVK